MAGICKLLSHWGLQESVYWFLSHKTINFFHSFTFFENFLMVLRGGGGGGGDTLVDRNHPIYNCVPFFLAKIFLVNLDRYFCPIAVLIFSQAFKHVQ